MLQGKDGSFIKEERRQMGRQRQASHLPGTKQALLEARDTMVNKTDTHLCSHGGHQPYFVQDKRETAM